jgi:hypothetical protein
MNDGLMLNKQINLYAKKHLSTLCILKLELSNNKSGITQFKPELFEFIFWLQKLYQYIDT